MAQIDEAPTTDEIIREVRATKETLARSVDYDIQRILKDARRRQRSNGRKIIAAPIHSHLPDERLERGC
ncbi:hypothetical protein [Candidatus Thiosymbion oneisti]|uniref:hypothetical protein n=1 Tax=Candidatus Thiosymbion oneisti TaxID=589554 RepID=UPI000B7F811A|nr:hypothetical protein [Candidatus Thiosymbion oneisti]